MALEAPAAAQRRLEDDDVIAERARLDSGRAQGDLVQLRHLRKVFATKPPKVRGPCMGKGLGVRVETLSPHPRS